MQLHAARLLTPFPLDGDTAEAPCRSALPTYRILLLPQVRPLGAAHLREEGVEVGRFPLAAAPVFHPAEAGKDTQPLGVWQSPHATRQTKANRKDKQEETQGILRQNSLLGRKSVSRTEVIIVFLFLTRAEKCATHTLHERLGLRRGMCTHPNHLQVRQKSGGIKREVVVKDSSRLFFHEITKVRPFS